MKIQFVDLQAQYASIQSEIDEAMSRVINSAAFIGGAAVTEFENAFATYLNVSHCVGCANGTDALEIALESLGIGPGDEVLVPAYTWVSTANAVCRVGATPVLVDVDERFYTMSATAARTKITESTRAMIPVHLYGLPADMDQLMELAQEFDLKVIEDCAQAHGSTVSGAKTGTFGHMATFSFYPGKNLGAYGDAGAMVTNDAQLADKARMIARLGQRQKHDHQMAGRNSRLDGLQAAILKVKLHHLDRWTKARQGVADWYNELLTGTGLKLPEVPEGLSHVYHLYVIQCEERDGLQAFLKTKGIPALIHYPRPLNQLGIFETSGSFPVADGMRDRILSLPIYPELTYEQVSYIAKAIREFYA